VDHVHHAKRLVTFVNDYSQPSICFSWLGDEGGVNWNGVDTFDDGRLALPFDKTSEQRD
jgi:hypothetical protein